jgi:curved DNA-binding protein CbpA
VAPRCQHKASESGRPFPACTTQLEHCEVQDAEARFKAIVEAYSVLSDDEARKEYDAKWGERWETASQPTWARAAQEAARGVRREWARGTTRTNPVDFDFDEWNRMHFGPENTYQARAAQQASSERFRARRSGAEEASAAQAKRYAERARTETDYHWRRLHRLRQARSLGRWTVPLQITAFLGIGYGVYAASKSLLGGDND